jgi:hypothetical protein
VKTNLVLNVTVHHQVLHSLHAPPYISLHFPSPSRGISLTCSTMRRPSMNKAAPVKGSDGFFQGKFSCVVLTKCQISSRCAPAMPMPRKYMQCAHLRALVKVPVLARARG